MSSSRNAPEWFGGGANPDMKPTTSKSSSSRSSSNNSRRTHSRRSSDEPLSFKSDRRKKSHHRKKSREVIDMSEIMERPSSQDQKSAARVAPLDNSSILAARSEQKKELKREGPKKPNFVERLFSFGLTPNKSDADAPLSTSQHSSKGERELLPQSERPPDASRRSSEGSVSVNSAPTNSRTPTSPAWSGGTHRRVLSYPTDPTALSVSPEYKYPSPLVKEAIYDEHIPDTTTSTIATATYTTGTKFTGPSYPAYCSGTESDNLLEYSEDESTSAHHPRIFYPIQAPPMNHPYSMNTHEVSKSRISTNDGTSSNDETCTTSSICKIF